MLASHQAISSGPTSRVFGLPSNVSSSFGTSSLLASQRSYASTLATTSAGSPSIGKGARPLEQWTPAVPSRIGRAVHVVLLVAQVSEHGGADGELDEEVLVEHLGLAHTGTCAATRRVGRAGPGKSSQVNGRMIVSRKATARVRPG